MKAFVKSTAAVLLIFVLCLSFAACGGGNSIVGSWKAEMGDNDLSTLEFTKDGKVLMIFEDEDSGEKETEQGSYKVEGNNITMTADDDDDVIKGTYSVKGNKLFITSGGQTIEFTRK